MQPLWRGSVALTEAPNSPKFGERGDAETCTRTFIGPYAKCLAAKPARGSQMSGIDESYLVTASDVDRDRGNKGILVVVLEKAATTIDVQSQVGGAKIEIERVELEKQLKTHPRYQAGGTRELSYADLTALERWESEPDAEIKADFNYHKTPETTEQTTLTDNAVDYAAKILQGKESYVIYPPVVRRTREWMLSPESSNAGMRYTAAKLKAEVGANVPTAYGGKALEYLKTGDRASRTGKRGKWEQSEEWTGAWAWDEDLYPSV